MVTQAGWHYLGPGKTLTIRILGNAEQLAYKNVSSQSSPTIFHRNKAAPFALPRKAEGSLSRLEDHKRRAAECLRLAREAADKTNKALLIEMAQTRASSRSRTRWWNRNARRLARNKDSLRSCYLSSITVRQPVCCVDIKVKSLPLVHTETNEIRTAAQS
jgi:hypothetical protein